MKRMKKFADANADTKQQWIIIGLIVVLIIITVMILAF